MLNFTLCIVAGSLLALGLSATSAQAQSRVFVAAQGSDGNPCTFALPCRTFQHAHDVVASNGEIDVLDPAGYGAVTITKAISIQGHGFSGITATSGTAITINAGASDAVNLTGLLIEGGGTALDGILFTSGASLTVDNCMIRKIGEFGILFSPSTAGGPFNLAVSNAHISDSGFGIAVKPFANPVTVKVSISRVEVYNNGDYGIGLDSNFATGTIDGVIADSVASGNNVGFRADTSNGEGVVDITILRSVAQGNNQGVVASSSSATLRLAQSTIKGNSTGWLAQSGGIVQSYGDNYIDDNLNGNTAPPSISRK